MKTSIKLIKVDKAVRIRSDIGDLEPLIDSISKVGLINPIVIDEENNLVAGYRRLEACKKLGFKEVDVKIIDFSGDDMKVLDVEVAENFFRKDFTPEEVLASEKRRQEILESRRKKGLFERFLLWLKRLFVSKPVIDKTAQAPATPETAPEGVVAESSEDSSLKDKKDEQEKQEEKKEEQEQRVSRQSDDNVAEAGEEVAGSAPQPKHEKEQSSVQKKSTSQTTNPSRGERPIVWRTS